MCLMRMICFCQATIASKCSISDVKHSETYLEMSSAASLLQVPLHATDDSIAVASMTSLRRPTRPALSFMASMSWWTRS